MVLFIFLMPKETLLSDLNILSHFPCKQPLEYFLRLYSDSYSHLIIVIRDGASLIESTHSRENSSKQYRFEWSVCVIHL